MASTHVNIESTASRLSAQVRNLVDEARRTYEDADKVKNICDEVQTGGDWAALAEKLGTTTASAQVVYTLLTAFLTAVKTADYRAVINRLG